MRHFVLFMTVAVASSAAYAQTVVPRLDESGQRGEIARKMKAKAAGEFDAADSDKDTKLSKDEIAKVSNYLADSFEKKDTDKDGFLNWEEFVGHQRWPK